MIDFDTDTYMVGIRVSALISLATLQHSVADILFDLSTVENCNCQ